MSKKTNKAVFKFDCDCGRMGSLEGVFISTKEKVDFLVESKIEVYFGEVLGKHSEIYGALNKKDFKFISDDPTVVDVIEKHKLTSGYNPFNYSATQSSVDEEFIDLSLDEIVTELIKRKNA